MGSAASMKELCYAHARLQVYVGKFVMRCTCLSRFEFRNELLEEKKLFVKSMYYQLIEMTLNMSK